MSLFEYHLTNIMMNGNVPKVFSVIFIKVATAKIVKEATENLCHDTESNHKFLSIETLRILTNKYQLELEQHNTVMI